MSEQLQVGANGSGGVPKGIGAAQVRLRWYAASGDAPTAVFRDATGAVVQRYPGGGPGVVVDGADWLIDLGRMTVGVGSIELLVEFAGHRPAGFVATVGDRTITHPGVSGEPDQTRLLARLDRGAGGWTVVPFDRLVLVGDDVDLDEVAPVHGRLIVIVDSSGSMAAALADGRVSAAVLDAVHAAARPTTVLRATDETLATFRLTDAAVGREVGQFFADLAGHPRRSRTDLALAIRQADAGPDDELVVVTDGPPSDVPAVHTALGGRDARWLVVGSGALTDFGPDRRRWDALTASGRIQRRVVAAG